MRNLRLIILFSLLVLQTVSAHAWRSANDVVSVEVSNEYGGEFRQYPLWRESSDELTRAYLQAEPEAGYAITVRNRSAERIGLVVAVDGRNIISGKKSKLKRREKMYVLGPYESATYRGWRTGKNRVNEFFFTRDIDSYAGAFGDYSAMGVIAVAAFRDRYQPPPPHRYDPRERSYHGNRSKKRSPSHQSDAGAARESAPGTGFGDERYSPTRTVSFDPERRAFHKVFLKYEWGATLCEMGIARCYSKRKHNRFWPDDRRAHSRGYAPYPPGYRHGRRDRIVNYREYR